MNPHRGRDGRGSRHMRIEADASWTSRLDLLERRSGVESRFVVVIEEQSPAGRRGAGAAGAAQPNLDVAGLASSRSILSDLALYFLHRPAIPTLIRFASEADREDYTFRIKQRLGINVDEYRVLNIHKIGIDAPARYVFEELMRWRGNAPSWPNHIATVDRIDRTREHVHILLLGGLRRLTGGRWPLANGLGTLFKLDALRIQTVPDAADFDNARYMLYECHGGYPIGVFAVYVRSSIAEQEETGATQYFMAVGFNFYGRRWWPGIRLVSWLWEGIHNRVTANVMNRFKQLCETRFQEVEAGDGAGMLEERSGA